jgi:hypothetical protein
MSAKIHYPGADPGFQVRGAHLKKLRRAEEGANIFGVFRVKNHDFTSKNHISSNCGERHENIWGISCEKSGFYAKKIIFFTILGGACAGCAPPPPPPPPPGSARATRLYFQLVDYDFRKSRIVNIYNWTSLLFLEEK